MVVNSFTVDDFSHTVIMACRWLLFLYVVGSGFKSAPPLVFCFNNWSLNNETVVIYEVN